MWSSRFSIGLLLKSCECISWFVDNLEPSDRSPCFSDYHEKKYCHGCFLFLDGCCSRAELYFSFYSPERWTPSSRNYIAASVEEQISLSLCIHILSGLCIHISSAQRTSPAVPC